jgi:hypothetical protein
MGPLFAAWRHKSSFRRRRLPLPASGEGGSPDLTRHNLSVNERGNKAPACALTLVASRGFIMETEHTETVVEKAVAFVKDMFGMAPDDKARDLEAKPEQVDTPASSSEDAMRPDPNAYTFKTVGELHLESAQREDGPTSGEAMRLDPHAYAFNKIVERSRRGVGE